MRDISNIILLLNFDLIRGVTTCWVCRLWGNGIMLYTKCKLQVGVMQILSMLTLFDQINKKSSIELITKAHGVSGQSL